MTKDVEDLAAKNRSRKVHTMIFEKLIFKIQQNVSTVDVMMDKRDSS